MKRREFIALVGGAAASVPLAARAQQRPKKIPRIGIIDDGPIWQPFKDALREAGYIADRPSLSRPAPRAARRHGSPLPRPSWRPSRST